MGYPRKHGNVALLRGSSFFLLIGKQKKYPQCEYTGMEYWYCNVFFLRDAIYFCFTNYSLSYSDIFSFIFVSLQSMDNMTS